MHTLNELHDWSHHRAELVREAEAERLARSLRRAHRAKVENSAEPAKRGAAMRWRWTSMLLR